jgi:hypothetical protein
LYGRERLRPNRAARVTRALRLTPPSKSRTRMTTTRRICSKHRATLKAVGRGCVQTGVPGRPWKTHEPRQMTRCGERNERFMMVRYSVMGLPLGSSGRCILQRFVCWGSRVVRGWPGNPGSDGALPYRLERRFMPWSDTIKDRLTLRG